MPLKQEIYSTNTHVRKEEKPQSFYLKNLEKRTNINTKVRPRGGKNREKERIKIRAEISEAENGKTTETINETKY